MYSRRKFLISASFLGASFGLRSYAQTKTQPELSEDLESKAKVVTQKISQIYAKQSEKFKQSNGYTAEEVNKFYLENLRDLAFDLKAITGIDAALKIEAHSAEAFVHETNKTLEKFNLGLTYNLIRIKNDLFAVNIRFYKGNRINLDRQAVFEEIGFKNYQEFPVCLVTEAFTADVRHTDFFPDKKDPVIYGQTITAENGKVERVLIFEQPIQERAKIEKNQLSELRNLVIVNELAHVFFRQKVPADQWTNKITDQLTMRHVAEAFSDYCSYSVCNQGSLVCEIDRIMNSSNPNYLLSKALTGRVLLPFMKGNKLKDVSQILEKLKGSNNEEFEIFRKSLLSSYSEYEAIQNLLKRNP